MSPSGPTARDLTLRYVLALSLVASLSLAGQVLIQNELVRQKSDARVINIAGRQRMLSQRLSKAALELRAYPAGGDITLATDEFHKTLELWERSHEGLQHGDPRNGLPGENSPEINDLFASGEQHFQAMRQAGRELLATLVERVPSRVAITRAISIILANEGPFLTTMDQIVLRYQREAERKVRTLRVIELGLFSLTLMVLTAEGFLVFKPAVRRVVATITELTSVQEALRKSQADLETKVEERTADLRRSEEHFRTLAQAVPQIVWTASADLRIGYFNRRWYEYTGTTPAQPSALGLRAAIHLGERARFDELWDDAQQRGLPFEIEHRLRAADGSYRWYLTRALPLFDDQQRVARWFGTCTNIEDQKQSQLAAENANRSKDEFVALISHELRTPLTSILGWVAMLRERSMDSDLVARATKIIERNAQTQSQLVEDLLDMSRIISGKMEIEHQPLDVESAITAAVDTVRPTAELKRIRIDVARAGRPTTVMGDARRLQQIFWNLLSNAIKFTPEDGRVEVRVDATDRVRVSVCDNGRGIDPQFLPHIFERFRQAQQRSGRSQGLGLGLAIVRQLVELHGGSIVAQSEGEGRGACFVVELPLVP